MSERFSICSYNLPAEACISCISKNLTPSIFSLPSSYFFLHSEFAAKWLCVVSWGRLTCWVVLYVEPCTVACGKLKTAVIGNSSISALAKTKEKLNTAVKWHCCILTGICFAYNISISSLLLFGVHGCFFQVARFVIVFQMYYWDYGTCVGFHICALIII